MTNITFADVVHQTVGFADDTPSGKLLLRLIDTAWVQRLRDISQTANTRLVFMFSEHSRFGHSLGVAYLASQLLDKLEGVNPDAKQYRAAIMAAALLHDVGHLAPGSHTAFKAWFPEQPDEHEGIAARIINEDSEIHGVLSKASAELPALVCKILDEDSALPAWTWEVISGGGWNVDRGNWCMVDSILAGVSYGKYNISALTESIIISKDGHLSIRENRLDAMVHFAVSRHAMYRQIYQHRVILACDMLNAAIARRARDLADEAIFKDETMQEVLNAKHHSELSLATIFKMREPWWRYHLMRWIDGPDKILADLSSRLINRRLFKTVRISRADDPVKLKETAARAVEKAGFDPRYYLHTTSTADMHAGDSKQSMLVLMDDGKLMPVSEAEPLLNALLGESDRYKNSWLVMPAEAKKALGRER